MYICGLKLPIIMLCKLMEIDKEMEVEILPLNRKIFRRKRFHF